MRYYVMVFKNGLVYDRQVHDAADFSINTYVRLMLEHGYGLEIELREAA